MKKNNLTIFLGGLIAVLLLSCASRNLQTSDTRYTDLVNPFIGTGDHGHVFLGANVPFGMVQLGPSQKIKGWDWCSG